VQLRWLQPGEALGQPDAVILPGSKQTLRDLAALQRTGSAEALRAYAAAGGHLFGLCGGLQMLGAELLDPLGLEGETQLIGDASPGATWPGLGLLPLRTRFGSSKATAQRRVAALWPPGPPLELEGFELHHGRTEAQASPLSADPDLGWWQPCGAEGGLVAGTYLHGVFDNGPWRRRWLNLLRQRRGLAPLQEDQPHHRHQREALLDRLAQAFEDHVDLGPLLA
jgi:adenosylcobyric acid synthase